MHRSFLLAQASRNSSQRQLRNLDLKTPRVFPFHLPGADLEA